MTLYDKYFNKLRCTNQITLCKKYYNFTKIYDKVVINLSYIFLLIHHKLTISLKQIYHKFVINLWKLIYDSFTLVYILWRIRYQFVINL